MKSDEIKRALIEKVYARLNEIGWNPYRLSVVMKVPPSSVSKWLSGKVSPTLDTLIAIEHTLRIKLIDTDIVPGEPMGTMPCMPCHYPNDKIDKNEIRRY